MPMSTRAGAGGVYIERALLAFWCTRRRRWSCSNGSLLDDAAHEPLPGDCRSFSAAAEVNDVEPIAMDMAREYHSHSFARLGQLADEPLPRVVTERAIISLRPMFLVARPDCKE